MLCLTSWSNFKAIVILFLGLFLIFLNDIFDKNLAVLVDASPLTCGKIYILWYYRAISAIPNYLLVRARKLRS